MKQCGKREQIIWVGLICIGVCLRYVVMFLGNNFDFESYCIVGKIAGNFHNVYAETGRYNYGPFFLCIQGLLYRVSQLNPAQWRIFYRILIVSVLTATDLGITAFIWKKFSSVKALLFFLNPISIIITGYHNQFDNIAILFALLSTLYFNEEKKMNKKDIAFVALFSISLIMKHILFLLPIFILFMNKLPIKKKIIYACVPPSFFLMSFVPFAISSKKAFQGIVRNVFRYRSLNNAPLLSKFYRIINFPSEPRIIVYIAFMLVIAWLVRKYRFDHIVLCYLIAMVTFSSAIANQYLVIPVVALVVLNVGIWDKLYIVMIGFYLVLEERGLGLIKLIHTHFNGKILERISMIYTENGYRLATWILFFALIYWFCANKKDGQSINSAT